MSLFVILALEKSPNTGELEAAAKELNYPIAYVEHVELKDQSGFFPVKLSGEDSGFETYFVDYEGLKNYLPSTESITFSNPVVFEFRWGSSTKEGAAIFYTAAIISLKYGGVVFSPEAGTFSSPEELIQTQISF